MESYLNVHFHFNMNLVKSLKVFSIFVKKNKIVVVAKNFVCENTVESLSDLKTWKYKVVKIIVLLQVHSMATANLKKSEELVTNTTAASKYIPQSPRICII